MAKTSSIITIDQLTLKCDFYQVSAPKAVVILVHGLGEYKARYQHVADFFNQNSYSFCVFDLRGHGDSEGKRGHTPKYEYLMDDLKRVIDNFEENLPVVLYGHSMGGNIVANYLLREDDPRIKAAIITSPWFRLSMKASSLKIAFGEMVLKIFPSLSQNTMLNPDFLSHDKSVAKEYNQDPKVHGKITPALFFSMRKAGANAISNAKKVNIPLLLTHGTADKITDVEGSKEFAANSSEKVTLKLWPELYHETHNEYLKEEVIGFTIKWLNNHI